MQFLQDNSTVLLSIALGVSELLALIPGVKSNSIFTLIFNLIKSAVVKKEV